MVWLMTHDARCWVQAEFICCRRDWASASAAEGRASHPRTARRQRPHLLQQPLLNSTRTHRPVETLYHCWTWTWPAAGWSSLAASCSCCSRDECVAAWVMTGKSDDERSEYRYLRSSGSSSSESRCCSPSQHLYCRPVHTTRIVKY